MTRRSATTSASLSLMLAFTLAARPTQTKPPDATANYLLDLEHQWTEQDCTHNAIVETILADDFQGTSSPSGRRYSKADAIAMAKAATTRKRNCAMPEAKVRFFGDNVAVVYGSESAVEIGADRKESAVSMLWTDTWLKRDGKWQIVAAHDMIPGCK